MFHKFSKVFVLHENPKSLRSWGGSDSAALWVVKPYTLDSTAPVPKYQLLQLQEDVDEVEQPSYGISQ